MELQVGQAVELMGVENAGLDITGQRGVVTAAPEHGLASVTLDGGAVVSVWPENLKILRSSDTTPTKHTSGDSTSSGPAAKGEWPVISKARARCRCPHRRVTAPGQWQARALTSAC